MHMGIKVLWIARYDYDPGWRLELHRHDYFQIIHVLRGSGVFQLNSDQFTIDRNLAFLIKPHETHGLVASAGTSTKTFDIKFYVGESALRDKLLAARGPKILRDRTRSVKLFELIRKEGEEKKGYYQEMCGALLSELLFYYLREPARAGAEVDQPADGVTPLKDPLIQKAVAFVRLNYMHDISVSSVAAAVGCSDRTLRLHFHSQLGTRPIRYLQAYRIQKAKKLMELSDYPLKWVAGAVGFKDIHHFTRTFTEAEGVSPGAWRRRHSAGIRTDVSIDPQFESPLYTIPAPAAGA